MKFIIVMCLTEYKEDISKLFKEAGISTYSIANITGVKQNNEQNLLQEWFAAGNEQFDSAILFSFTADKNAHEAKQLIEKYNKQHQTGFPVRVFIISVEDSI